jgi:3-hydroxybutyryl-CoA dehydrogenase
MSEIGTITVIGAGTMGRGIAQVAASAGYEVVLHDAMPKALDAALDAIRGSFAREVEKGRMSAPDSDAAFARIRIARSIGEAASAAGLVIEAVPESLALKKQVFEELEAKAPASAVLASNTSSLPVGKIAEATASPERVVGMHFFNPVPAMALIEIVRAEKTSESAVDTAVAVGKKMGKEPIVVRDSPGFATSRLGVLLGLEAMRMLEEGVATAEDIDKAMTLGYKHPMGPLKLTDLVGLDVRLAIAEHLHRELASEAFRPPQILERMVREGKLGKKTGEGFYRWEAK